MNLIYQKIQNKTKKINIENFVSPVVFNPFPITEDYKKGYIERYFCKKVNDGIIIEIDKEQHDSLVNKTESGINYFLYNSFKLKWKISGPKKDKYKGNVRIEMGVEDTNKRMLIKTEKSFRGISKILSDLLEFF